MHKIRFDLLHYLASKYKICELMLKKDIILFGLILDAEDAAL